jgi:hypothetical protein
MRQWLDGFNAGWIEFDREGAAARKGTITIDQAIAALVGKEAADGACHTQVSCRRAELNDNEPMELDTSPLTFLTGEYTP